MEKLENLFVSIVLFAVLTFLVAIVAISIAPATITILATPIGVAALGLTAVFYAVDRDFLTYDSNA